MDRTDINNIKKILKSTYLSFLFGAGTSYHEVDGKQHYPLMKHLVEGIVNDSGFKAYKQYFDENISQRVIVKNIIDTYLLCDEANIETFLSFLEGSDNYITDTDVKEKTKELQKCVKAYILNRIESSDESTIVDIYSKFYKSLRKLKEQTSFPEQSFNVFTTNYDMLNEISMENIGTHYYSGFNGLVNRKFNITYYGSKYVNSYNIKNSQFILDDNHINLYKLHGSISWQIVDGDLYEFNPKKVEISNPEIIYPSVSKFDNTNLITYYSALMREFSNSICKKDSTLVVCGTSLRDEHINKIIENALLINSFTLIIFAYGDEQIKSLEEKYKHYDNAIVYNENTDFEKLATIISEICNDE